MRPALLLLPLAAGAFLVAACGSASRSASKSHPGTAPPAGPPPGEAVTKPQALAFAHAVNLTAEDVPGFTPSSQRQSNTPRAKQLEQQMLRCIGPVGSGPEVAEASSENFELKRGIIELGVSSSVGVAHTPASAARELAAIRSPRVRECFAHYLTLLLKSQDAGGAVIGPVSIASGNPPAHGTTGGFGWRITAPFTVRGLNVAFFLDVLGFVYGPARVTLFSSAALRPFPAAPEQRLYSLLLSRAKAHTL